LSSLFKENSSRGIKGSDLRKSRPFAGIFKFLLIRSHVTDIHDQDRSYALRWNGFPLIHAYPIHVRTRIYSYTGGSRIQRTEIGGALDKIYQCLNRASVSSHGERRKNSPSCSRVCACVVCSHEIARENQSETQTQ